MAAQRRVDSEAGLHFSPSLCTKTLIPLAFSFPHVFLSDDQSLLPAVCQPRHRQASGDELLLHSARGGQCLLLPESAETRGKVSVARAPRR